jgi:protocatechuate 3,4-dioxygenase beta subunit
MGSIFAAAAIVPYRETKRGDARNYGKRKRTLPLVTERKPMLHMPTRKSLFAFTAAGALALCAALGMSTPSFAAGGQSGAITGTVDDAAGAPVAGAEILLSAPTGRYRAHTDKRGKFTVIGVLAVTYTLTVEQNGVVRATQPDVSVDGDQTVDVGTISLPAS